MNVSNSMTRRALCCLPLMVLLTAPASATPAPSAQKSLLSGMDATVLPGDDFNAYANGEWLKGTEIPADRAYWGTGSIVAERTLQRTRSLLEQAASDAPAGTEARKIGDYYASFMDEAGIEKKGLQPLQLHLAAIAVIRDRHELARELGSTLRADVDALNNTQFHTGNLLGLWVAQDLDDPGRYAAFLLQGGLSMPDRDFYIDPSPHMQAIREKFRAHIAAVLRLARIADADAKAARIFELEHRIAAVHWKREDSEQVRKADNHWQRADLDKRAPGLDWASFLSAAHLQKQTEFVLWQPSAITGIAALVASEPLETWKDYLTFHAIEHVAAYLPKAFVAEQFAFYGAVLSGTPELRPRWKRAVDSTGEALGEAVGKLYVQHYFPPSEKRRAEEMVRNLLAAFSARIDHLSWMSAATKVKAKAKLATLKVSVGYPDQWRDYSGLRVVRGDALGNAERAELFEYNRNLAKLGKPVDRGEWVMTPQTVNAVNLPVMNAINFPAAILQPPFFDPNRPMVMDYGAIGSTIGHEISHSFDDQGAQFDASGKLQNWWTPADLAHFEASAAQLVAQFDAYRPFPDVHVNGRQTLSENLADVAGLAVAYDAYHRADPAKAPAVEGFSADQLFFLSFGQSWRQKIREASLRQRLVTDGHAPARYRADTVRNLDSWYAAFDVKPGQTLYLSPQNRVRMW
jgi:putative endopeptidase